MHPTAKATEQMVEAATYRDSVVSSEIKRQFVPQQSDSTTGGWHLVMFNFTRDSGSTIAGNMMNRTCLGRCNLAKPPREGASG